MPIISLKDGNRVEIRKAHSVEEVRKVQAMEYKFWGSDARYPAYHPQHAGQRFGDVWTEKHGLSFARYEELFGIFVKSLHVALDESGVVLGYNAFVSIGENDIKRGMPPYNFNPRKVHKYTGNILYIVNHTAPGCSDELMAYLKNVAADGKIKRKIATPTWTEIIDGKETHPYLVGERGDAFWTRNGFVKLEETRDPEWSPIEGGPKAVMTVRLWTPSS